MATESDIMKINEVYDDNKGIIKILRITIANNDALKDEYQEALINNTPPEILLE